MKWFGLLLASPLLFACAHTPPQEPAEPARPAQPARVVAPALPATAAPVASPAVSPAPAPKPAQAAERADIYDEKADGDAQVAAALARAKKDNQRVLIQWGANWCGWCHLLHDLCTKNPEVRKKLLYEYQVVLVDIGKWDKHLDLAAKYGADFKASGVPYLTFLDADGKVLAQQETGSLEAKLGGKDGHDPKKVVELLTQHQAKYLVAAEVRAAAFARAQQERKRVFEHFGAPW